MRRRMEEESESVRVKDIILKRKIGNGSFSAVWRAEHRGTGEEVAVKQVFLSKLNLRLKSLFHCELNFLSSVNHPNIVRLLDFFQLNSRMAYTEPYLNHKLCPLSKIQVCFPNGKFLVFLSARSTVDSGVHDATNSLHRIDWPTDGKLTTNCIMLSV
ncbi:cyclin-dependent kinase 1-like isoform X2 [Arachis ipaensis]|uniref:cyclin-dependent kinase 1-like isoform X2 n=1 Tax=Arachis ipaensis TaxID=130454 RepID=UPI000A2B13C4|nr:cyclin-dependent kinase 1-like isoform X2 [Arachis ipaensis]